MSLLLILTIILAVVGFVGCIIPAFPGLPFAYAALVCSYYNYTGRISFVWLIVFLILTIVAMILDYVAPMFLTKWGGGSKKSITGASIGMAIAIVCIFIPYINVVSFLLLIILPMVGAYIGELKETHNKNSALKMALFNFLSFLMTTMLKLVLCIFMLIVTFFPAFA